MGVEACDVGGVGPSPAEVADRLHAAGEEASLDSQAVADLAALVGRCGEGQHLSQRRVVPEQPALEQGIEEAGDVVNGGDERTAAGGAGHRRVDAGQIHRPAVELEVAVRMAAGDRPVPGRGQIGVSEAERADHPAA